MSLKIYLLGVRPPNLSRKSFRVPWDAREIVLSVVFVAAPVLIASLSEKVMALIKRVLVISHLDETANKYE